MKSGPLLSSINFRLILAVFSYSFAFESLFYFSFNLFFKQNEEHLFGSISNDFFFLIYLLNDVLKSDCQIKEMRTRFNTRF